MEELDRTSGRVHAGEGFSVFSTALLSMLEISGQRHVGPIEFIKRSIREEFSILLFKTLLGIVLASTIFYAIFQLGEAFQGLSLQLANSFIVQLIGFGGLAIAVSFAFGFLFKETVTRYFNRNNKETPLSQIDLESLLLEFLEGFVAGLNAKRPESPAPDQRTSSNPPRSLDATDF